MAQVTRWAWLAGLCSVTIGCGDDVSTSESGGGAGSVDGGSGGSAGSAGGPGGTAGIGGTGGNAGTGGSSATGGTGGSSGSTGGGSGSGGSAGCIDPDHDGYGEGTDCLGLDCEPDNGGVHPGATEICNGFDDNCNNETDEGLDCRPALWVFLLAGQSNMVGLGFNNELPPPLQGTVDGAVIFYEDSVHPNNNTLQWLPLGPGFGVVENRFGPELTFGQRVREDWPDRNVAIIKVAEGGTGLHDRWAATNGDLYQLLLGHVQTQMAALSQQWRPQIVGFVWMQGETDALSNSAANAYAANFQNLIGSLRTDLGLSLMPVTAGLISPAGGWPYADIVRAHTVATASSVGQVDVVETVDLPTQPTDIYHYTSESFVTLGQRFATAAMAQVPTTWNNALSFSAAQGDGFWVYLERSPAGSELLVWDGAQNRYVGSDAAVLIGPGWMHPGADKDAELAWWTPYDGRATISVDVADADGAGGDGVDVEIELDGVAVWGPTSVGNGASVQHDLVIDVAQKQVLSFRTTAGPAGDAFYDTTSWDIDIVIEPSAY